MNQFKLILASFRGFSFKAFQRVLATVLGLNSILLVAKNQLRTNRNISIPKIHLISLVKTFAIFILFFTHVYASSAKRINILGPGLDADLSSLTTSPATSLSPTFISTTTNYTTSVKNATAFLTVIPTASESTATITVNGYTLTSDPTSGNVDLAVGENTIDVVVTAEDGETTKTYTKTVTRAEGSPVISSFSPLAAVPGDAVTIVGTGFNTTTTNNIVFFGATQATVTAATATSLTVTVPTGATYAPITVLNTGNSLACFSGSLFTPIFSPAKPSITASDFLPKQDFTTGSTSTTKSVAIGDLDGDGQPDLAVANGSNTVSVFRNTSSPGSLGAASFAAKVDFTTGTNPVSVAIGDLDGDGQPDLAVANRNSNTVSVFRNTSIIGNASFAAKVDFTTGSAPTSVAISDLDGDGQPDLAVANWLSNSVSVFRNTSTIGNASFAAKQDFTTGSEPYSVAIGDLDGDGQPDLALANLFSNSVSVFRNTSSPGSIGAASFAAKQDFATGRQPTSLAIGDLDGDGQPDLAVANGGLNTVSVFRNTSSPGSTSFAAKVDFTTGTNPVSVAIGDLDGDGQPDLAVANANTTTVSVFRNTSTIGNASFAAKQDFTTGSGPTSVAIGDLDGDGQPDLAAANNNSNTVSVFRNTSTNADLSVLSSTVGTVNPVFAAATTAYTISVLNATASITVTPTLADANATIKVNGNDLAGDPLSASVDLAVGENTINVVVTAQDGVTIKTYTLTVTRAASTDATLSALSMSQGTVTPEFDPEEINYTASVANETASLTITPTATEPNATIKVNGNDVAGDPLSASVDLAVGENTINVVVAAQDGVTIKTYTITVTRTIPEINLKGNKVSIVNGDDTPSVLDSTDFGSLNVASGSETNTFWIINDGTSDLTIGANPVNQIGTHQSDFTISQPSPTTVSAGDSVSFQITFDPTAAGLRTNTISITNDDADESPYTFDIQGYGLSYNADLSNLTISEGTLAQVFDAGILNYTTTVANNITSLTVTPTAADANATITVNDITVANAAASGAINLDVGENTLTVIDSAEDRTSRKIYTLAIIRNEICSSQGTDTRSECSPFTWIDGNTYTENNNTTTFTIVGGGINGCDSLVNLDLTIINSSTSPSITPLTGSLCPNTSVTLSASGGVNGAGASIHWYTEPNGAGTLLGTGNSINEVFSETKTFYARREGTCNTTADASVTVNLKSFIYALDGTTSNTYCTDNAGWHHFYNGNDVIFSLNGDISGAALGYPIITIAKNNAYYEQNEGPNNPGDCDEGLTPGEHKYEMERNWNVDFGNETTNPPYSIRFYHQPSERTNIETAAAVFIATNPSCSYTYKYGVPGFIYWFANAGNNYLAPAYDGIHISGSNGTTGSNVNYVELSGLINFGSNSLGGTGAVILMPSENLGNHPEINLKGNNVSIINADDTPSFTDSTDFGAIDLAGGHNINSFTVENLGTGDLHLIPQNTGTIAKTGSDTKETSANPISYSFVNISGDNAEDFSIYPLPTPAQNGISSPVEYTIITPGNSLPFQIIFVPTAAGLRTATISIANNDADENPYTFNIQGIGCEPLMVTPGNEDITWTGAIDTDWNTPCNWSPAWVPDITNAKVIIPVTANNPIIGSLVPDIKVMNINAGASLEIDPMGTLNVRGNGGIDMGVLVEGTFTNKGQLNLESVENTAAEVCIYLKSDNSPTFSNYGTINLNSTIEAFEVGFSTGATIINYTDGVINIKNGIGVKVALETDVLNFQNQGTFNYDGSVLALSFLGTSSLHNNAGIFNINSGTGINNPIGSSINNYSCGKIIMKSGAFVNGGMTNNFGLIQMPDDYDFIDEGSFNNDGVVKANTFTINNPSLFVKFTITNTCNIFTYEGGTYFTVVGIYTDEEALTEAGTYTAATNTFVSNSALPLGYQELYAKVTNTACVLVVPFQYNKTVPTGASTQTLCEGASIADIVVSSSTILEKGEAGIVKVDDLQIPPSPYKWYNAPTGGDLLSTSEILQNGVTYYVSETVDECEGTLRFAVTVTLNPKPEIPSISASDEEICIGESINLSVSYSDISSESVFTYHWTDGITGQSIAVSPSSNKSYKVAVKSVDGCSSDSSEVKVIVVIPLPIEPILSSDNETLCKGNSVILSGACEVGMAFHWITPSSETNAVASLSNTNQRIITTPGTYTAYCENVAKGCLSGQVSISITQGVDCENAKFLVVSPELSVICPGESVNLTVTGCSGTLTWVGESITSQSGYTASMNPANSTTYFITCSTGGSTTKDVVITTTNKVVNANISTGKDYVKAVQTVESSKKVGNPNITPAPNVIYEAGKAIYLKPGFEAGYSSTFSASIKTCPN